MLLIETNLISNMGCQKIKVVRSLSYSGYLTNTSCVCQVAGVSKRSNNKQQRFFPKKNHCVSIRDFKKQKILFSEYIVTRTRVSARDYTVLNFCPDQPSNVCSVKKDTKPRSNTLLCLVSFFTQMLVIKCTKTKEQLRCYCLFLCTYCD
jgi:hypothetical protein